MKAPINHMHDRKGSTLVELVIAMVIIAIAVVVSLEFFVFCQKNFIINSTLKLRTSSLARETMEGLNCGDPQVTTAPVEPALPAEEFRISGGGRSYTVTQGNVQDPYGTDYKSLPR